MRFITCLALFLNCFQLHAQPLNMEPREWYDLPIIDHWEYNEKESNFPPSCNLRFEALYWQANQNGLLLGTEQFCDGDGCNGSRLLRQRLKWDWGFRGTLDCNLECWDLGVSWTYFRTNNSQTHRSHSDCVLELFDDNNCNELNSEWKLRLNMLDLDIGYKIDLCRCLWLRPHIGLRGVCIDQEHNQCFNFDFVEDINRRNRFEAIGMRAGFDSLWPIAYGFSIVGDVSAALLYGRFHVRHQRGEDESSSSCCGCCDHHHNRDHFYQPNLEFDFKLGLRWEYRFFEDQYYVACAALWEQTIFFEQNQFFHFDDKNFRNNPGNLAFSGLTLRFDLGF